MPLTIDASALADVNPYSFPTGWTNISDTWRVTSHVFKATYSNIGLSGAIVSSPPVTGDLDVTFSVAHNSTNFGDSAGALFVNSSNTGYVVEIIDTRITIKIITNGVLTSSPLDYLSGVTYTNGATFRAVYHISTNTIDVYQNTVSTTTPVFTSSTGLTYTSGMSNGVFVSWTNVNASGIISATAATLSVAPVAYTSNASGNANTSTTWTPNGVPTSIDTVSIGAHTITVPAGFTWNVGAITMTGTSTSARSEIVVKSTGQLKQAGHITLNTWNRLTFEDAATWDVNGFSAKFNDQAGTGVHNWIQHTGTATLIIKNSGAMSTIGKADGTRVYGRLDLPYANISGVNWRFGGGSYAGHHFRLSNVVFQNYGYFDNFDYSHVDDDWYMRNVDFRNCLNAQTVSSNPTIAEIYSIPTATTTPTGVKQLYKVTFSSRNLTSTSLAVVFYGIRNINPDHMYFDKMQYRNLNAPTGSWSNVFSNHVGVVGENGSTNISNAYIVSAVDTPKPLWLCDGILNNLTIESNVPSSSVAVGEHFAAATGRTLKLNNLLLIDTSGSGLLTAVSSSKTGTYEVNYSTVVYDIQYPSNGMIRNESGGSYASSSSLQLNSSIEFVRSNPSGNANIRVFNMETAGDDQIKYFDYNSYFGVSSSPSIVYYGVTSATKSIGQAGYGQNDWINTQNPQFVDSTRNIQKWGTTRSVSGYDNSILYLMNTINGFNSTTSVQDPSLISGYTVVDLATYVRNGFAPTNPTYKFSGAGGVTRGAIEAQSASITSIANPVLPNSTNNSITCAGLGTLTYLLIGGKSAVSLSAPSGVGTFGFSDLLLDDTYPPYGTNTVTASDGSNTAISTTTVSPKAGKTFQTMGTLATGPLCLKTILPTGAIGVNDQVTFSTAASLGVPVNLITAEGGIQTDFVGVQEILIRNATTGIIGQYFISTGAASTTPNPFTFTNVTNAALNTLITSNTITVTGITAPTTITTGGKPYKINSGSYVTADGTVNNNDTVTLQLTSSGFYSTPVNTLVNIGGVTNTWTVTTVEALALYTPTTVTESAPFTITFNKSGTTKHLYLETTDGTKVFEQIVDTWNSTNAVGSYLNGNWLQVLSGALPSGTTNGLPFTSSLQSVRLRLTMDTETSTLVQNYIPPTGYTKLDFNSTSSNTNSNSAWNSISGLANGDQILVQNTQTATDSTPLTIVWSSDGTPTPSSNLAFNYSVVYYKSSTGKLTKVSRSYVPVSNGIVDVNSGTPLHAGNLFTVTVSGILTTNIHFVQLQIGSKIWILAKNANISSTVLNAYAPIDLPVSNSITVSVKEWKTNATSGGGSTPSSDITWASVPKTSDFNADAGIGYFVDTSVAPVTMTLPPVPTVGQKIAYMDYAGTFSPNIFTINPNGKRIYGNLANYTTDSINESTVLIYTGETQGWKFLNVAPSI